MNTQAAADAYLESRVLTAAPHQLHLLVIEAGLRHSRKALEALEQKDFEVSYFGLSKARECVDELIFGLNDAPLPELSEGMKQLFLYVHRCLRMADLTHDPKQIADGIKILEMHRDNWLLAIERAAQEIAAGQQPVAPAASASASAAPAPQQRAAPIANDSYDEPRSSFSLIS